MKLQVYLKFNGNCREAFEFYSSVFGASPQALQAYKDGPAEMGASEADLELIMHASLPIGSSLLMGSDSIAAFGGPVDVGSNFAVLVEPGSREQADSLFAKLAEGGSVVMPLQDTFWGAYFGSLKDKFGIEWQLHHQDEQQG